jgi:sec-independent protein translocase protein TatC
VVDDPRAIADAQRMNIELVNLSPGGGFFVAFQVAIYGGLVLASPFIFYFGASFIFPALKIRERKYVYRGLGIGVGLFLIGVSFCYFILMPVALAAAQMYSNWLGLGALQWRAEDYISFVCKFMLGMGLGFELPVVLLTLVKVGVLSYATLSKARRYMIVINLILGAVLTTPEPVTQLVMFVPLQGLYEVTVWIAWYWDQTDRARARRLVLLWLFVLLLIAGLAWTGWKYGWPLLWQHLH